MPTLLRLKPQWKCVYFLFSLHNQIAGTMPVFIIVPYVKRGWLLISNLWTANIVANPRAFHFLLLESPESEWIEMNRCLSASSSWGDLPKLWKISFSFKVFFNNKSFKTDVHWFINQLCLLESVGLWESYWYSHCLVSSSTKKIKVHFFHTNVESKWYKF